MSYFCFDPTPESKYHPSSVDDDYMIKPLLPQEVDKTQTLLRDDYPGSRRTFISSIHDNDDSVLIKTGGNALQKVDRCEVEGKDKIAVIVPENTEAGDTVVVVVPNSNGTTITASIPEGHGAGSVFFVSATPPVVAVASSPLSTHLEQIDVIPCIDPFQPAELDLELAIEGNVPAIVDRRNLVLVTVPTGSKPGDVIRIQLPDQRIVEAVLPAGEVRQFLVNPPPSQMRSNSTQDINLPPIT